MSTAKVQRRKKILQVAWMSVCREWCVSLGRGLCDGPILRPEESCRLWCVIACGLETSRIGRRRWVIGPEREREINGRNILWKNICEGLVRETFCQTLPIKRTLLARHKNVWITSHWCSKMKLSLNVSTDYIEEEVKLAVYKAGLWFDSYYTKF
jgi:hypothetical protein